WPGTLADGGAAVPQVAPGGGAKGDDRHRLHDGAFGIEPNLAALDLVSVGPLVKPPLAAHFVLEVLHRVGDENLGPRNSRIRQRPIENAPGGADEGLAAEVFLVAGLLADQHDVGGFAPLARYRLRRILVERAAPAFVLGFGKLKKRVDRRRKLKVELRPLSHRLLLTAAPRSQRRADTGGSARRPLPSVKDIKKSLCLRCRRW